MEHYEEPFEIKGHIWFVIQNKIGNFNCYNKMYYLDLNDTDYSIVCGNFIQVSMLEYNEVTQTKYVFDENKNRLSLFLTFSPD